MKRISDGSFYVPSRMDGELMSHFALLAVYRRIPSVFEEMGRKKAQPVAPGGRILPAWSLVFRSNYSKKSSYCVEINENAYVRRLEL